MKKVSNLLVIVTVIGIMAVGVSFGYFVMSATITGKGAEANVSTSEGIKVIYDAGDNTLVGDNLMPGVGKVSKEFKVTVVPTSKDDTVTYAIKMVIDSNGFVKCDDTNYSLANACDKGAEELVYTLKTSDGTVIKTGDLTGKSGEVVLAKETKTVTTETDFNYIIEITYKDTDAPQNHNMNKNIEGKIKVEFSELSEIEKVIASANTTEPNFSKTSCTSGCGEATVGVYQAPDGMYGGTSYYFRGNVDNNYVKFAGYCWRIVRINGDGSIRLIYDGTTCHANGTNTAESIAVTSQKYNASSHRSEYVGYTYAEGSQRPSDNATGTASILKTQTENWYNKYIAGTASDSAAGLKEKGYDAKVATGKFCNDRETASGSTWESQPTSDFYYAAYGRLRSAKNPTLSCTNTNDVYNLKAGAITADEVSFAGGVFAQANNSYYLYNGQYYWTMSPYYWYYYDAYIREARVSFVWNDGQLGNWRVVDTWGVRPVINLVSGTQFKEGTTGTQSNPYEVL